ncbi:hypothetical protein PG988_013690 [Apiospora saccharicola]
MTLVKIPEALPKGRKEAPKPNTNTTAFTATLGRALASIAFAVAVLTPCIIHGTPFYWGGRGWFGSILDAWVWGSTQRTCAVIVGRPNPYCTEMVEVASVRMWTLIVGTALGAITTSRMVHGRDRACRVGVYLFLVNYVCFFTFMMFQRTTILLEARVGVLCTIPSP